MPFTQLCEKFNWERVHGLFGVPYRDPSIQALFLGAGISPDLVWREHRVGIYTMPPFDQQPCPMAEIDLSPSFRVRVRFKHAKLVKGALTKDPEAFVLAAVSYFLDWTDDLKPFPGNLPHGILPTDTLAQMIARVGKEPTQRVFTTDDDLGYVAWEDRNPILHVLHNQKEDCPVRINVYLSP